MSASFDDQASQSTNNDQHSETSSANPQSPRSSSVPSSNLMNQFSHHHHPSYTPQHYQNLDTYLYPNPAVNFHQESRNPTLTSLRPNLSLTRRSYTGVDKLIMAAMMEESAAVAAVTGASGFIPSGRGIGYLGGERDSIVQIPTPSNKSELELYRLLERANLLNYFGTFLNFGGDDVQQLSDADEDEFLEIMSLVGMTQKPLHVRRLQKALIDWRESRHSDDSHRKNYLEAGGSFSNRHLINPAISVEPLTPTSISSQPPTSANDTNQNYIPPYEVLIGAPKRLKLMDSMNRRSSNQESLFNELGQPQSQPRINKRDIESPTILLNESSNSNKTSDKEGDKSISVTDSSQSGLETEHRRSISTSPNKAKFSHNKFGRYKASLQNSPGRQQSRV